jgi:hypothetical protein
MGQLLVPEQFQRPLMHVISAIDQRIKDLQNEKAKLAGAMAMCEGAIQDCLYWKEKLDARQDNVSVDRKFPE